MTKVLMAQGEPDATAVSTANTTEYWVFPAAGGNCSMVSATETQNQVKHHNAGVFSDLSIRIGTNGVAGTSTFTFRKNGADGNMQLSIPSSSTGIFTLADTSVTDTIAAGDLTTLKSIPGATTGTIVHRARSCVFNNTSSSETISRLGNINYPSGANLNTASSTSFEGVIGEFPLNFPSTVEADSKCRMRKAGTLRNPGVRVLTNARTTSSTLKIRKNGVDTAQVITIPASTTGWIDQDTPGTTVSVAVGDDINWSLTTGTGTGALRLVILAIDYVTTDGWFPVGCSTTDAASQAAGAAKFQPLGGFKDTNATETNVSSQASAAFRFAELAVLVSASSGAATVTVRQNAADSALVANIAGTGVTLDSTHTITTAKTDLLAFAISPAAANTIKNIIMWGQEVTLPQTVFVEWEE